MGAVVVRQGFVLVAVLLCGPSFAQMHVSKQPTPARVNVPAKVSSPKPFDCKAMTRSAPWQLHFCEQLDYDVGSGSTRRLFGMPRPSREVVTLPAHGTSEAKRYGVACMNQLAMRRLDNGWEQLRDRDGNYLRCRDL